MDHLAIWTGLAACVLGGYFAACNLALKAFSRKRLAELFEQRGQDARFSWLIGHVVPLQLLTGMLRTTMSLLVLLCALIVVEQWRVGGSEVMLALLAFVLAGVLVSVFVVAIPASWARYHPEALLARSVPLLRVLLIAGWPMAYVLSGVDPIVRRITGADLIPPDEDQLTDQVLSVVEEHETGATAVDDLQKEMLEAVFDLSSTSAGEIMTPRTDVKGIEVSSTMEEVKAAILSFGHSRIPVFEDNLDHIQGILYAKDMIRFLGDGDPFDLRSALREAFMVPESKSVRELLAEFKARKVHLAIVLDEYGGTAGLVTIEDILEEIVGDIQDEYEPQEQPPQIETDGNTAEVDARMRIDDLNDAMDVDLPENEDYDTVGGFVFATLGHIPDEGETFEFDGLRFTVTSAERTKVNRVKLERSEPEHTSTPSNGNGG
ncbi:MAG: hemolysin family protein [bacterium]